MKKWTKEEVSLLDKLLFDGLTYEEIGVKLNRSHRSIKEKCNRLGLSFNETQKIIKYEKIECLECGNEFKGLKNYNRKFCSKSCSITFNNKNRIINYEKTKKSNCIECGKEIEINLRASSKKCKCDECNKERKRKYDKERRKSNKKECNKKECNKIGKIKRRRKFNKEKKKKIRICKKCNQNELKPRKQYCDQCSYDYYHIYRPKCVFKFSLDEYPDKFDFDLIKEHGWYSPTNKNNNLTGVSRDHIYSVKEGFENGINPKIISHPANCQLLIHTDNSSKNKSSDITIQELLQKIKEWN
jgi:hypothetical protein